MILQILNTLVVALAIMTLLHCFNKNNENDGLANRFQRSLDFTKNDLERDETDDEEVKQVQNSSEIISKKPFQHSFG